MEVIKYPSKADWPSLVKRPALDVTTLFDTVRTVLNEVRSEGDAAVKRYEEKFDKVTLSGLQVSEEEIKEARELVSEDLKQAIRIAKANIEKFHAPSVLSDKRWKTDLRSNLLAESSCHRKGRPVYPGRNGPFVLNRINVGGSCTYRRM